jgi:4-hydroxy-2-oxoheptanedioate aldolase
MRKSLILEKISKGKPAWCTTCCLTDPVIFELVSLLGLDGIWVDLEHHGTSVQHYSTLTRASRVGNIDIVARPGKGEFMRMSRLLEMGATGIMYPRCDGPDEAAEVVKWAKFPPLGKRGFDGGNPDSPYDCMSAAEYTSLANQETFILAQLEDSHAVEQAEAILAVPGVSMIMLGPADFSMSLGLPGQTRHPKVLAALNAVASAARNTGKAWAATSGSVEQTKQLIEMGCGVVFQGNDMLFVKAGVKSLKRELEQVGFSFEGYAEIG